jgi:hypothetical protein
VPDAASGWGRWAVSVAVIVPVLYAVTRWAWPLGIPLGISEKFLREGQEIGLWGAHRSPPRWPPTFGGAEGVNSAGGSSLRH